MWRHVIFVLCTISDIEEIWSKHQDLQTTTTRSTLSRTSRSPLVVLPQLTCSSGSKYVILAFPCACKGVSVWFSGTSAMSERWLCKCVFSCERFHFSLFSCLTSIFREMFGINYAIVASSLFGLWRTYLLFSKEWLIKRFIFPIFNLPIPFWWIFSCFWACSLSMWLLCLN